MQSHANVLLLTCQILSYTFKCLTNDIREGYSFEREMDAIANLHRRTYSSSSRMARQ
jgi:hypothetical protein